MPASAPRARLTICIDVDGTLTDGVRGPVLPGAIEAVRALRAETTVRLVTNTTSVPYAEFASFLGKQGLLDSADALWTPVRVARDALLARGHESGLLIADPGQRSDYGWFREDPHGPAVLLATEAHDWTVAALQPAFRRLLDGAAFYALSRNRYYRKAGTMVTDVGGVAALLAFTGGREPETFGKPSRLLFEAIAREVSSNIAEMVMVGDDAEVDVSASIALGMKGVLVKTGKYRAGDEARVSPAPSAILDGIGDLPAWLRSR